MKANQQVIGGRYQYNPLTPLRQNSLYSEFKAYDRVTKRDLLMQLLPRDDRLIQLMKDVKHPFVLSVLDIVVLEEGGGVALVTESGCAAQLADVMDSNSFLMEEDALVITKFIALTLRELHQKLIIFGRLCPENVFFCQMSLIKLGYNVYEEQVPLAYQSPEMLQGVKLTPASDVYSLGVILYRMVYGVLPFEGYTAQQVAKKIKKKEFNESYKEGHSPFRLAISKQVSFLLQSMLDFYQENRPTLEAILSSSFLSFPVQTDLPSYQKPKVGLLPQPFIKKYLIYRASKMMHKYDDYYQQASYMALNVKEKRMVTIYCPQVKMFEAEPRKIESFFEKLRAIQQNEAGNDNEFLIVLEDADKFRQEPIFVTEYCNQGTLFDYLEKRKISEGWLKQKEINLLMYILALGIKQMRELGVSSIHTMHSQRVMIKDKSVRLREPGLLTPPIEKRLVESKGTIDYFAPELKENLEMTQLDRSDMWSYGVLYYYLIAGILPVADAEGSIDIQSLKTDQKNRNIIGKCLDYSVETRLQLQNVRLEGVDEDLLQLMLQEKHAQDELLKEIQQMKSEEDDNEENVAKDRKVMFKNRKKAIFKNYNKILAESTTTFCRVCVKTLIGIAVFVIVFFGLFIINGGYGLIRSYYFNPITLQVPYNYGTSLIDMTILTTNGANIMDLYSQYSYQQFTKTLRCATDAYTTAAPGRISDFINSTHTAYCLFGFIYMILFLVLYAIYQFKLDLPTILNERNKEKKDNKNLFHFLFFLPLIPSLLFCFFYTFALEYLMQITPCFGLESLAYPKFTSIEALLNGDSSTFFLNVFLTVILWAVLMLLYGYFSLVSRKLNARVFEWKLIIPSFVVMVLFTIICRVGFGSATVLQPTWSYKINRDLVTRSYYGFFGMFPEPLFWAVFLMDRIVDLVFWYFLKRGLEGVGEEDIKQVKVVQAKYEALDPNNKLENDKSNIYMIEHDFERFE